MLFVNVILGRLVHRSSWLRLMRITSRYPEPILKAIQTGGREAKLLASRKDRNGRVVHTMQLAIFRLEEVTLTDIIHAVDPEATVDVVQLPDERTSRRGWKRHSQPDVPDVSKYGNEFSD